MSFNYSVKMIMQFTCLMHVRDIFGLNANCATFHKTLIVVEIQVSNFQQDNNLLNHVRITNCLLVLNIPQPTNMHNHQVFN